MALIFQIPCERGAAFTIEGFGPSSHGIQRVCPIGKAKVHYKWGVHWFRQLAGPEWEALFPMWYVRGSLQGMDTTDWPEISLD